VRPKDIWNLLIAASAFGLVYLLDKKAKGRLLALKNGNTLATNNRAGDTARREPSTDQPNAQTILSSTKVIEAKASRESRKSCSGDKHWLDYVTAIFAFLAAIGGIFAAIFTGKQARIASDTEQRQFRAYVHPTEIGIVIDDPGHVTVHVRYRNFGQTPAFRMGDYTCIAVRQQSGAVAGQIDLPDSYLKRIVRPTSILPPQDSVVKSAAVVRQRDRRQSDLQPQYLSHSRGKKRSSSWQFLRIPLWRGLLS
jgi:hypothetical protein